MAKFTHDAYLKQSDLHNYEMNKTMKGLRHKNIELPYECQQDIWDRASETIKNGKARWEKFNDNFSNGRI